MLSKAIAFSLLYVASAIALDPLVINTPAEVQQCVPTLITWSGGRPSYQLLMSAPVSCSVLSGGHLIRLFLDLDETQFTWQPDIPAGTEVALQIVDSIGETAQTAPFVIQEGSRVEGIPLLQQPIARLGASHMNGTHTGKPDN
ncbi:hypothetical protein C2E23DRAFT_859203 [Lenzites betulinus]|nr:hypothetical protein C2E23DRAFT_859203 [Lenzites betulinus]